MLLWHETVGDHCNVATKITALPMEGQRNTVWKPSGEGRCPMSSGVRLGGGAGEAGAVDAAVHRGAKVKTLKICSRCRP